MGGFRGDLLYAMRVWRRQPGTTVAAILTLAVGIGLNTTIFSFVSGILLRPLPYRDPGGLVALWQDRSALGGPRREVISPGLFVDWSTRAPLLQGVAALRGWSPNLTGRDASGRDEPERLTGALVSGAYFSTLGVAPARGRTLTPEDDRPGAPNVVVLSDALWRRRFGADAVGSTMLLDGQSTQVVGVMPATFRSAAIDADLWGPLRIDPANAPRGIVILRAIARLAPGATVARAQAAMATLQAQLQTSDEELVGAHARVVSLHEDLVGPAKPVLVVLGASVVLVLLIACANVASLLMARATGRRVEMAVRLALGADRRRLVRQLLTESSALAVAGALSGLALAFAGVRLLIAAAPPAAPRLQDVRIDTAVLVFTAAVALVAALVAGLAPSISSWSASLIGDLREGARETRGGGGTRSVIVAAQIAAAMALVLGAGLFVKSLIALERVDLGFLPDHVLTASVSPPRGAYRGDEALRNLFDRLVARASALPGVEAASFTSVLPLSGMQINFNFDIEGRPPAERPGDAPVAAFRSVGPAFLQTFGMTVVEGRGFTADDRAGAPGAVVVNQALVKRYFDGRSPIGAHVNVNGDRATVVGVVADVHHTGPAAPPDAEMYVPYAQLSARGGWLVLRTSGDPAALTPLVRQAMREIDPNLPLGSVRPMASLVASSVAQPRFLAIVLSLFSAVAAGLALVGVYSLLEFSVSRRTREIGVRMALGARRGSVVALVVRQSLTVVAAGVIAGAAAGAALSRVARTLLFGVPPGDPSTVALMAAVVIAASILASILPAHRAAHLDPVVALREE